MAAFAPKHLLEQARTLLACDTKRPRQANLRRAVSASYYALCQLLIQGATNCLTSTMLQPARLFAAWLLLRRNLQGR